MTAGRVPDDLDAWVLETAPRAVAYARSLLQNLDDADDVVQDCYCRLLAKADVYDLPRDGLKLLMRSVTNACINLRSRQKAALPLARKDADGWDHLDDPEDRDCIQPLDRLAHGELATAVAAGLKTIPAQQRAALEMKSLGYTQFEIAEILDVTPTNAGVLVHRGRQALAVYLAPFLGGEVRA